LLPANRACCCADIYIRLAETEVDDCNIADVMFMGQIYNVLLEQRIKR
jgi:hypothetical protein